MATTQTLLITFADGSTKTVKPTPGDLVRFEREYGIAVTDLADAPKLEHVLFLAYAGLKRSGEFEGTFDEFLDQVDSAGDDSTPLADSNDE